MRRHARSCALVFAALAFVISADFDRALAQTPTPTPVPIQSGQVIISEFRLRGPVGAEDEFVELYNNTDSDISVQSLDGSAGWTVALSDGQITGPLFTVPNGTLIPARGHLLGANSNGYSLCNYPSGYGPFVTPTGPAPTVAATPQPCVQNGVGGTFTHTTPDRTWDFDVPDGSGVALFATTNGTNFTAGTRLDAAGFTASPALYKEGGGIPGVVTANLEHTYYRDLRSGLPKDTGDNAADFMLVGTAPGIQVAKLGAPGPENLNSPIVNNTTITATLLDPSVSSTSAPNRERTFTTETNATFGTMVIRRTINNNTGQPISRLRFRVVNITTFGTPGSECTPGPCADLRALTSQGSSQTVGGQIVPVLGLRLEEPPEQPAGGGYNASVSADTITFDAPLPAGQSLNVEFKLGVERTGPFRFFINIEAQNGGDTGTFAPVSGVNMGGRASNLKGKLNVDTVQAAPTAPVAPSRPAAAAPTAAPRNFYVPLILNSTRPAPKPTRAEEEEKEKEDESKGQKSEEAPPPAEPAQQAPEAPAPETPKKRPAAAKARPVENQ